MSSGNGHSAKTCKDFICAYRSVSYDYVISIENKDAKLSTNEGLLNCITQFKQTADPEFAVALFAIQLKGNSINPPPLNMVWRGVQ